MRAMFAAFDERGGAMSLLRSAGLSNESTDMLFKRLVSPA